MKPIAQFVKFDEATGEVTLKVTDGRMFEALKEFEIKSFMRAGEEPKSNERIKVKIIKGKSARWTEDREGEVFEVIDYDETRYLVPNFMTDVRYPILYMLLKVDCEVVDDSVVAINQRGEIFCSKCEHYADYNYCCAPDNFRDEKKKSWLKDEVVSFYLMRANERNQNNNCDLFVGKKIKPKIYEG